MTRNSEIRLEDLTRCDHRPEIAVAEEGEIVGWVCRCGKRLPLAKQAETKMEPVSKQYTELSPEKQAALEPWIEQFDRSFGLEDHEKIAVLLGMALGYCTKAGLDFNALLGAALAAEGIKQEEANAESPEDS